MRRMRSVKAMLMEKVSFLPGALPGGSLARILYLLQDSECRMRTRSSSGRLARSRISLNVSFSSAVATLHVKNLRSGAVQSPFCALGCARHTLGKF